MKLHVTARGVALRLSPLHCDMLARGEGLSLALPWPGGGWRFALLPGAGSGVDTQGGAVTVTLSPDDLQRFLHERESELHLPGPPAVRLEKDRHADWPLA